MYIKKNPNSGTLIAISDADTCPDGYEPSDAQSADAWIKEQLDAGWTAEAVVSHEPIAPLISRLSEAFKAAVPAPMQGQFGIVFGAIGSLLANGETDLAKKTIEAVAVPPELETAKANLLVIMES